jgi:adenosylhomocysteine nucleosidase
MLIWMCALHCEAKPVIDFYRLKKNPEKAHFDLYSNNGMSCIVSGMGANKMIQAVQWGNNLFQQQNKISWINLGIAGHKSLPVGTAVLINQASLSNNTEILDTQTKIKHHFESKSILSILQENTGYKDDYLFDMEAHAFLKETSTLSSLKQCQSIKVISDNSETTPTRNKEKISNLIAGNMKQISEFAKLLQSGTG